MPDDYWATVAREADERRRAAALENARGRERRLRETAARGEAMARKPDAAGRLHCAKCRRWLPGIGFWKDGTARTRKMSWCKACLAVRTARTRE